MKSWRNARILMTTDAVGGVWSYSTALAGALAKYGYNILLVTLGPPPHEDQLAAIAGRAGVEVLTTDYMLEWMDPEGRDMARAREGLLDIAGRFKPDLVHLNGYREVLVGWDAPVLLAAHSCVWTWWQACRGSLPDEPRWMTYAENVRHALDRADRWVAPTESFRTAVERTYQPAKPNSVVHNGTEKLNHCDEKEPFILAAGRLWDEAKNISAIERVASRLNWPVRLAGPEVPDASHGFCAASCEFLGRLARHDLLALMGRASIYAAPSLYEPFGLSVLEAAGSGCALVLSGIPAYRELWRGAALFIDPHDDDELCATLRLVCEDGGLRERLQRAARQRAHRYSVKAMAAGYLALYRSLIEPRAKIIPADAAIVSGRDVG